jgi:chromosome segregation ATPase
LPGIYTIKLTVADKTYEERAEVRLDPTISVPSSDLQAQIDLEMKLRDMQSAMNSGLRFLDSIEEQLKHTQTTVKTLNKEPDKDLMKAMDDYVKQIESLEDRLARRTEGLGLPGKSQVANKIGGLFSALDGPNAAPTAYQRQYFEEIQPEFRARMAEVNKFIEETVPRWNEKLAAWNVPTLTTRKPIQ